MACKTTLKDKKNLDVSSLGFFSQIICLEVFYSAVLAFWIYPIQKNRSSLLYVYVLVLVFFQVFFLVPYGVTPQKISTL